jgi:hypothetical protein
MSGIFISYCRDDRDAVDRLLSALTAASLEYWLDESDILPSMEFNAGILEGLTQCQWFLIAMTPRAAASEYVKDELHWALTNRTGRIIPVMLEKCEPAAFHLRMMRIQYVDLTPNHANGLDQLQRALRRVKQTSDEGTLPLNNQSMGFEMELVALLLTFVSRHHQKHIRNLLTKPDSDQQAYVGCRSARHELRDLCTWGVLNRLRGVKIAESAGDGCRFVLSNLVELTALGKRLAPHVR